MKVAVLVVIDIQDSTGKILVNPEPGSPLETKMIDSGGDAIVNALKKISTMVGFSHPMEEVTVISVDQITTLGALNPDMIVDGIPLVMPNVFVWRSADKDTSGDPRLLIPHSNPNQYEDSMDWIFPTAKEAIDTLKAVGQEYNGETLVLCREVTVPYGVYRVTHNEKTDKVSVKRAEYVKL